MKAVIMAGGEGQRLRPLTCDLPKPMVPVLNKPVMQHIIELLRNTGIKDIAVTLAYLPEKIKDYFQDGRDFEVNLKYYVENEPLGTAGSVKNAEDFLDSDFIVISGDALCDIDLKPAIEFHKNSNSVATLVLKRVKVPLEYGVVITEDDGKILRFLEKPSWSEVMSDTVNTGIYILSPEVLKGIKKGENIDFGKNVFPKLLEEGKPMFGYVTDEYWCDIGDAGAYMSASKDALSGNVNILKNGFEFFRDIWIDEGTVVEEGAHVSPGCIIGRNCIIKKGAIIEHNTIIGNNVTIGSGSSIKGSIIWDNCVIGENAELRNTIVCNRNRIEKGARAFDGSIIGFGTHVKENATIHKNVKIWPEKIIDVGTEVSENIIFTNGASKETIVGLPEDMSLFAGRGVKARLNSEIFPDQIARLGTSFGAILSPGAKLAVATDGTAGAQMAAMSFISGAMGQGSRVYDCGRMTMPVLRYTIRQYNMEGGAFFKGSSHENLEIIFMDSLGCDINKNMDRKLKSIYRKKDFMLTNVANIQSYERLSGLNDQYVAWLSRQIGELDNLTVAIGGVREVALMASEVLREKKAKVRELKTGDRYDIGALFDPDGETLEIYDENKNLVKEETLKMIVSLILFEKYDNLTMIVPVSESHVIDELAEKMQGRLERTGVTPRDIMNKIAKNIMAEGAEAQFNMRYDAVSCLLAICDYLKTKNITMSQLCAKVPAIYMEKRSLPCDYSKKGTVMRSMLKDANKNAIQTIDGIKIYNDKGWVLILPDSDGPTCKIITESFDSEYAQELADIYSEKIRKITLQ